MTIKWMSVRGSQKCPDGSYKTAFWYNMNAGYYACNVHGLPDAGSVPEGTIMETINGGTKMWTINTQKDLKGTVEVTVDRGMIWHITSPFVRDINYGPMNSTPATWIDEKGIEQIAVIKTNEWGAADIALDTDRSFGNAEIYKDVSEVDIISQKDGYTTQLGYPKNDYMLIGIITLVGILGVGYVIIMD